MSRLTLISAALPPVLDGIGDYTALLAAELAKAHDVTVVTARGINAAAIPDVKIVEAFEPHRPASMAQLLDALVQQQSDWIILQYNPFGFGRRGFNLHLPRAMAKLRRRCPNTRLAIMFHETYVPLWPWKFLLMTSYQRWQFYRLGQAADVVMFSIEPWARQHRRLFPKKPVHHLPVGSNVPHVAIDRVTARCRLGIEPDELVIGVFGSAHASRLFHLIRQSIDALIAAGHRVRLLYIGPDGVEILRHFDGVAAITDGPHPPEEVSRRLAAIDLFLATYVDGISTRRGAMLAALQHGLPMVATRNFHTDPELLEANGEAFILAASDDPSAFAAAVVDLAADAPHRARLATGAEALFQERYAWAVIARRLLGYLHAAGPRP